VHDDEPQDAACSREQEPAGSADEKQVCEVDGTSAHSESERELQEDPCTHEFSLIVDHCSS